MAKRSFASQLAKGFVRSAVNQVGRDGGRVISNQIYNGQNYVPVADVTPSPATMSHQFSNIPQSAEITTKHFSGGKITLLALTSFLLSVIGGVIVFIYGLLTYLKKTDKIRWYESVPQYARDRRYKTGERYLGNVNVKKEATVAATPESIQIHKKNGIIAMIIGCIGILLYAIFMIAAQLQK